MKREAITHSMEMRMIRSDCYGKCPSVVAHECSQCVERRGCFNTFTVPHNVFVLDAPRVSKKETNEKDREMIATLGIDFSIWMAIRNACKPWELYWKKYNTHRHYLGRFVAEGRKVPRVCVKRADTRRVILDIYGVQASAAMNVGAQAVIGHNGEATWRLKSHGDIVKIQNDLDRVLNESMLLRLPKHLSQ